METLLQDLRYGLRALRQTPGFTVAAVLILAFGTGANTAIFSMVDAFLLRRLPVKDPQQLVVIKRVDARGRTARDFAYAVFEQLRDHNRTLAGVFAYDATRVSATAGGEAELVDADFVSGNYFEVLGVNAALGRALTPDDDRPGHPAVAVISYGYWKRHLGSDPGAIGRVIHAGGTPLHVIGVMPSEFFGRQGAGKSAEIVVPMVLQPQLGLKDHTTFHLMGRLKPGGTLEQARADLDVIYRQALAAGASMSQESERAIRAQRIVVESGVRGDAGDYDGLGPELRILLAAVGLALLIASMNIANLLLARGAARQREISVRLALGAGRGRVVQQLLVESVLLALLGGAAGLLLANWLAGALVFVLSLGREPVVFEFSADPRVLAFTAAVSVVTGILFGLAPALAATREDLNTVLKGAEGRTTPAGGGKRLGGSFVVLQVALSIVLLVGAGLLIRRLWELYRFEPGFERSHVVMAWVFPVLNGYDHGREMALYRELFERVNAVPGVQSASLERLRLVYGRTYREVRAEGGTPTSGEERRVYCNQVGPRFFETMRIPLLLGREFSLIDTEAAPKVAIISAKLAQRLFPKGQPIGGRIGFGGESGGAIRVVGVVGDIRHHPDERQPDEAVYIPYTQAPLEELGQMNIVVRTATPGSAIADIRRQVRAIDKNLPLRGIETQEEEIDEYLAGQRSLATLLSMFGGLALLLASIGLYGTMSYAVGRRTRELGIRLALGAQREELIRMVLGEAFRQVGLGVALGIPAAVAAAKLAGSAVFGIRSADPVAMFAAVGSLAAVALLAAWLPARRATKVDPVAALR